MISIPAAVGNALRPPERVSVHEWAEAKRVLPSTSAEPGKWRTSRTPYMLEPMEAVTPGSGVREIWMMFPAQNGKSEFILNILGHSMEVDPCPMLVVQPTMETARSWSKKRLKPMIDATPSLRALFGDSQRNPKNSTTYKEWPGGFCRIAWATSASELASDPIRRLLVDEIDKYPLKVNDEGNPLELAKVRTQTFSGRELIVGVSTPSIKGASNIEAKFLEGDQRHYYLPCPHCEEMFTPELGGLVRVEEHVVYECPHCLEHIGEVDKRSMVERGEWRAHSTSADGVRSYHLSGLVSPWMTWRALLDAHDKAQESNDPETLQVFWNGKLGLPFQREDTEQPDWNRLYSRRGGCELAKVPMEAVVLTAGVDVQHDRLEVEVVAWGPDMRSWSVEYLALAGDPSQPQVWRSLDEVLTQEWEGEEGATYYISRLAVDTGYLTTEVYKWCGKRGARMVMPVKGSSSQSTLLSTTKVQTDPSGQRLKHGIALWKLDVDTLKERVMRWITLPTPTPDEGTPRGWCEWPEYAPEYFMGLCAEQRVLRGKKFVWEVVYKRNEPLDCRVYALSAAMSLGLDRWTEERWQREQLKVKVASREAAEVSQVLQASRSASESDESGKRRRRKSTSNYLSR